MSRVFALIGNPNCGKTTLFNQLTGSKQHVGNFPGVTVEKKEGKIRGVNDSVVVDLPGIYSMSPYTNEEVVTRDFLLDNDIDCIIDIVDATNIERNLYLTLQLMELKKPMIIALNMMDEIAQSGGTVFIDKLSEALTIPVVPISASKNEGIDELIERAVKVCDEKQVRKRLDFCTGEAHKAIHAVCHLVEGRANANNIPVRFAATKLIEGDKPMEEKLGLSKNRLETIEHIVIEMEERIGMDREAAIADMRYTYIENLVKECVKKGKETKSEVFSVKLDAVLTHRIFAIPIFIGIMSLIFYLTFAVIGKFLSDILAVVIDGGRIWMDSFLTKTDIAKPIHSLIIDGIFNGVGSVLSFLPIIVTLFLFLSILEDSGYMARVAFVMDKLLRKIGLSGRSFVPMLIGFGCSVPAIMASRTLPSERDRKLTVLLTPFMSCSAKLPVYALFTAAFFEKYQVLVMVALYIIGILVAVISGYVLENTVYKKGKPVPFVMELPTYRFPSVKSIVLLMWEKCKDFLYKAFTVIFVATILIWLLQNFDATFHMVKDNSYSMLADIGRFISPIFKPLGFDNWMASTALVTGFSAKEAVVSTLTVLLGSSNKQALLNIFTPLSAFSFLTFTLLYMPCVAAFATTKKELGIKYAVLNSLYQTTVAWIVAFIVFNIGCIFF